MSNTMIYDIIDRARSINPPTIEFGLPHVKSAFFAIKESKKKIVESLSTYTVKAGDTLSAIAKEKETAVVILKDLNNLESNTIRAGADLYIPNYELIGEEIQFTKIRSSNIYSEVYLVVETENMQGQSLTVQIKSGKEKIISSVDNAIEVSVAGERKSELKMKVGEFAENSLAVNKQDHLDKAIIKISFKPKDSEQLRQWTEAIDESEFRQASLYLSVDAHSDSSIASILFSYYGHHDGDDAKCSRWWYGDGLWFTLKAQIAPWMKIAKGEIGQKEKKGAKANDQILEYFKASKYWGKDDSGSVNAWCGSFVAWVMKEHGEVPVAKAYRAKEWKKFGKTIEKPVYGAIGIKSRSGGGHVAFIVGTNEDGTKYYMLGGNQDDEVNVRAYPTSVWETFVVPVDFKATNTELPIYTDETAAAKKED